MKLNKIILLTTALLVAGCSGCGKEQQKAADVAPQPTQVPVATATPMPTATPIPTVTPAPRSIGVKTETAKKIMLTNNANKDIRQLYLRVTGEEDWGKNLIPSESSIKTKEQVQLYYEPIKEADAKSIYDMQLVDSEGNAMIISGVELSDMEKATLRVQEDTAFLLYMSLSEKKQKDTRTVEKEAEYDESAYDETEMESEDTSSSEEYTENDYSGYENNYQQPADTGNQGSTDNGGSSTDTGNQGSTDNSGNSDNTGGGTTPPVNAEDQIIYEDTGNSEIYDDSPGATDDFMWDESGEWG